MNPPSVLDAALKRLGAALDHLEAAAERRARMQAVRSDAEEEFAIMQDDRSRLAVELDGTLRRLQRLEHANQEAARRLDHAGATIRAAIGSDDSNRSE